MRMRELDDDDSLSSLKKSKGKSDDVAAFNKLSLSIKKHSKLIVTLLFKLLQ
jgi:hypothetical protein